MKDLSADDIALVQQRLKGRSLSSIASELGLTREGVRLRVQRALGRLLRAAERRHAAEERCRSMAARIRELELVLVRARAEKSPHEVSVAELDLSLGEYLRLTAKGIRSLADLTRLSRSKLRRAYGLKEQSLEGVEAGLAQHGLELPPDSSQRREARKKSDSHNNSGGRDRVATPQSARGNTV